MGVAQVSDHLVEVLELGHLVVALEPGLSAWVKLEDLDHCLCR